MIFEKLVTELKIYIKSVLNIQIDLLKPDDEELKKLPYYITEIYNLRKSNLYNRDIIFLFSKTEENLTPLQYFKHIRVVENRINVPVVIVFENLESFNRKRLIEKQVGFILLKKVIFIPQLLIKIKEFRTIAENKKNYLNPADQFLLLYHLLKEDLTNKIFKEVAKITNYSPMTITRAFYRLEEYGICDIRGKKEKTIIFEKDKRALWKKAEKYLRTPVKKRVYTKKLPENITFYKSGINALSHYTDLNDDDMNYYAVSSVDFDYLLKNNKIFLVEKYESNNILEVWKYPPSLLALANKGFVDLLSLYIIFRDEEDERILMELDKMIKEQW